LPSDDRDASADEAHRMAAHGSPTVNRPVWHAMARLIDRAELLQAHAAFQAGLGKPQPPELVRAQLARFARAVALAANQMPTPDRLVLAAVLAEYARKARDDRWLALYRSLALVILPPEPAE